MTFDLHAHSTRSDGLLNPAELVARAAACGVEVLALTDHDELDGLPAAQAAAAHHGITLVPGVEISVSWQGQTIHIVGLQVNAADPVLCAGVGGISGGRMERAQRIAAGLAQCGISGALEGAQAHARNPGLLSRTHFARFLVEQGHARDTHAVFSRFLVPGKPGYVAHEWAHLNDAVVWIRAAGGLAVLAHPGRYKLSPLQQDVLTGRFKDAGGHALEVVSGSQSGDQTVYWGRMAQRFGLLASSGSDFHGPGEGRWDLGGQPALPAECVPVWTLF